MSDTLQAVFNVDLPARPYPGLRPFEKHEWLIFFGRERMADAIVKKLVTKRLLVIHGDSGCGKSSLVRAAVLPRLEQENARAGLRWRTCTAMPRGTPLLNIAEALADIDGRGCDDERVIALRRVLNFGPDAPTEIARLMCKDSGDHVCILIDQFEELFEHARTHGPGEAQLLTQFLIALQQDPPPGLYVILTMRSEFLGACAHYRGFAEAVNVTQYLLPRMDHSDLLRAICEPARLFDGEVSQALAERLIVDAGGGQDQLPLIQHGLMLLFEQHVAKAESLAGTDTTWRLGMDQYQHTSGLAGLLSNHADEVLKKAQTLLPLGSRLVELLFRALTDINAESKAIRRPQTIKQLIAVTGGQREDIHLVVNTFRIDGVSFLTPHGQAPLEDNTLIDISHEALIRCWQKIDDPHNGWLIREFRNGLIWRALLVQADSFEQDAGSVLGAAMATERDRWIRQYNEQWTERYGGDWERVKSLLAASIKDRDRARRKKLLGRLGVVMSGLFLLSSWVVLLITKQNEVKNLESVVNTTRTMSYDLIRNAQNQIQIASTSEATNADLSKKLNDVNTELNVQAEKLEVNLAPRVYLHISDEAQRESAQRLALKLTASRLDNNYNLAVPRITLADSSPPRSVLRCFQPEECASNGVALVNLINRYLQAPEVTLEDLSSQYKNATNIRPEHYELWFGPGVVEPRAQ
ncbi:ATP-binding protein [Pseudomonas alkylphenolica]|uniref:ATP-binding protein n=1 Tax=Pseudomonas alkylphenolica TaxID=237609 RepID=UPI0018D6321E|nr:ATP-binding protein [Pseudomonas alkylphenolica]MBH3428877.1 ATP-binding protein [Pseudomonas alkylphenolica]